MVDLRSKIHGAGATQGVNLVVMAYHARVARDAEGVVITHFLDARVHPGDRRAPGQTSLALVSKKDATSTTGFANSARYTPLQLASIEQAAADNATDLIDVSGRVVGRAFGVRADLLINSGEVVVNTRTLTATELSVGDDEDGRDIRAQIVASVTAARRARDAARALVSEPTGGALARG
ncbi:hypothetical protein [Microbacterium sp. Leaf320]|uniref:hypothetical protein n=1 Tax=Microbacterium sp. Leaf320 TaxID=1736334 RepID=UPI0006FB3BF5|nr:hypothetical protein [Microbacterium sp. Leaf320]KQQ64762.1 hypothetical protein ASF63_17550 [Microbacterium sp. Leaf320]